MADPSPNPLPAFYRLIGTAATDETPDHELLRRFADERDEVAFEVILRRHGSMVTDVCRSVSPADTDDAFQATFLVLATNASSIRKSESLSAWLHGVAYRVSLRARTSAARRRVVEGSAVPNEQTDAVTWDDARAILHEELARLPARIRVPLVHCYLNGQTQDEAAQRLGLSKATLKRRLETGRSRLRERLIRRGLGPAAVVLAAAWPAADARPPTELIALTLRFLPPATGISERVATLTHGVLNAMRTTRLKTVTVLIVGLVLVVVVGTAVAHLTPADPPATPKTETPAKKDDTPPLAKSVKKVEVRKLTNNGGPRYTPRKAIEDAEKIAELIKLFPGVGADQKYVGSGRSGFDTYLLTLHEAKGDPIEIRVLLSADLNVWYWFQGKNGSNEEVKVADPKQMAQFLDELLAAADAKK